MNPSSNESFNDAVSSAMGQESEAERGDRFEAPSSSGESVQAAPKQPAAAAAPPLIPLPPTPGTPVADPLKDTGAVQLPASSKLSIADDDLIEKEWVDKAKAIVEKTRGDPHKQSEELTVFKADYMHKRYNKSLATDK